MYTSIFTWVTLLFLTWQFFNYKHGSSNFLPGALQASKCKYIQHIYMGDLTTFTSKNNNMYVDVGFSFCLVIFVWNRFRFLCNRINFQINTSFHQLMQHGFIRCMRNDIYKYLQVSGGTQFLSGTSTGYKQNTWSNFSVFTICKQQVLVETICLVLPQDIKQNNWRNLSNILPGTPTGPKTKNKWSNLNKKKGTPTALNSIK